MAIKRIGPKPWAILIAVVLLAGITTYFILNKKSTETSQSSNGSVSQSTNKNQNSGSTSATATFTYVIPKGWAKLSPQALKSLDAADGIGRTSAPAAKLTIDVSTATPETSNLTSLTNSILNSSQRPKNFQLVSNTTIQVAGQTAQKLVYTFGDVPKQQQELVVLIHNNRVYSLLFTGAQSDFYAQQTTFDQIVNSFKFK